MDMNKMTQKVQDALQAAQAAALRFGHAEIDGEHVLLALCEQQDGLTPRLLQKLDANVQELTAALRKEVEGRPRVGGPGANSSQLYASRRLSNLLVQAQTEAGQLKDEYISVEHILLAVISEGERTVAGRLLKKQQVNRDKFTAGLNPGAWQPAGDQPGSGSDLRGPGKIWARPGRRSEKGET